MKRNSLKAKYFPFKLLIYMMYAPDAVNFVERVDTLGRILHTGKAAVYFGYKGAQIFQALDWLMQAGFITQLYPMKGFRGRFRIWLCPLTHTLETRGEDIKDGRWQRIRDADAWAPNPNIRAAHTDTSTAKDESQVLGTTHPDGLSTISVPNS